MEKILKTNKILIILGIIVVISIISFFGLYIKENGVWNNLLKEYNLGIELKGYRDLHFSLDTTEEEKEVYVDENGEILGYVEDGTDTEDTSISLVADEEEESSDETEENEDLGYAIEQRVIKTNEDEDINIENFDLSKKIIQNRLNTIENFEYNIRVDSVTGELVLEVPDDDTLSTVEALITSKGIFDIIDYQNGIVLLNNDDITNVTTLVNYEDEGYQCYLQVALNDSGKEKISEISKKYVQTTDESGEASIEYISVRFEGQALLTTYFGEEITDSVLTIPIGNATTDLDEYLTIADKASRIANILNGKTLPLQYTLTSDNYIKSTITDEIVFVAKIVCALAILIVSAILIVKFKLNGFILSIVSVGYIAVTTLLLRYADVVLTLNSIYTLVACAVLNYIFIIKFLKKLTDTSNLKTAYAKTIKEYYLLIIPVIVVSVVFTFVSSVAVNTIGMTLFWGILTGIIYNTIVIFAFKLV